MITLFNPTNETLKMMYGGISVVMEPPPAPSHKLNVEDPCGRHLLNAFAQRGLCQLIFGDDEKVVGAQGIDRNMEFKKGQIVRYNTQNEQRKMSGMGYLPPTDIVKQYAFELGIKLLEPYSLKDAEVSAIHNVVKENIDLKGRLDTQTQEMSELKAQMQTLISLVQGGSEAKKSPREIILENEPPKKGKGT
jgi:hypothetical protein